MKNCRYILVNIKWLDFNAPDCCIGIKDREFYWTTLSDACYWDNADIPEMLMYSLRDKFPDKMIAVTMHPIDALIVRSLKNTAE